MIIASGRVSGIDPSAADAPRSLFEQALRLTPDEDVGQSIERPPGLLGEIPVEVQTIPPDLARETGLRLVRHGTGSVPVETGLRLLTGSARPEDIRLVRTIGLLPRFGSLAVDVLETIPGAANALMWLADRSERWPRDHAVSALCRMGEPDTFPWLLRTASDAHDLDGEYIRRVAETVSLAGLLETEDATIAVPAGRILRALVSTRNHTVQIREYADACRAVSGFAVRAGTAEPVLDLLASVITMARDLRTGHTACLPWPPGERVATLERLERLIGSPRWARALAEAAESPDPMTRWRAQWATVERAAGVPSPGRLAVHVVVPDPVLDESVQTRLLVDGRPVVAEAFRKGGPFGPDRLPGILEATEEPRKVRLAEAWCTEGCCGALYVTITRKGDTVIWHDWCAPEGAGLETFHFAADHYDETIARAARDRSWEWPARGLARRLNRLLQDHPALLGVWECELDDDVHADPGERDRVSLTFTYPCLPPDPGDDDPWLQFLWVIPVDDSDVDDQAARVVDRLRAASPTTFATVVGGCEEYADRLGFPWP